MEINRIEAQEAIDHEGEPLRFHVHHELAVDGPIELGSITIDIRDHAA
jgi:hypothetical protein